MTKVTNSDTAQKILDAALALWSEKGYNQSTMRELAKRTGMGVSSLYFYFQSKEEIVQFLYRTLNERARLEFRATDKGEEDLGENFKRFLEVKLALMEPHRSCLAALAREAVDPESGLNPLSSESSGVLDESLDFFSSLIVHAKEARGDKEQVLTRLMWLAHIGILLYWLHDRTPGFANTRRLIDKVAGSTKLFGMLGLMPGANDLMRLVTDLFPDKDSGVEAETIVTAADAEATPSRRYDVVVIGAGPIGMVYASFLKQRRPRTRILVLDRAVEPGHKIGESTLSGFCKAVRSIGINRKVWQRLFYPKNGLGFFHIDESLQDLTKAPEYILETFDETFQVERRVLDSLLIANAQRLGVEVMQGAKVEIDQSTLTDHGNVVVYSVGLRNYRVGCSLVVDGSGPAGVIAHKYGLRTTEGLPFQTSAVWSYFAGVRPLESYWGWRGKAQSPRDHYTQHLCFREGWLWYIPLVSWQEAPTANLARAIERLLRPGRAIPTRPEIIEEYACPSTDVVSVGMVLRSDRDSYLKDDPRAAFQHYKTKYPAIAQLLDGAGALEDYYGTGQTFMSRQAFRGYARQVAGDGWLLIGDAAFFVDPLISPGLTGGVAGAFQAVLATARALDADIFAREFFTEYQSFIRRLHEALERDNQLVYMSFNHPGAMSLVQRFQEIDARRHFLKEDSGEYSIEDTNVWGILDPSYQEMQKSAWNIMREEELTVGEELSADEQSPPDYERMVERLTQLIGPYVDSHQDLTPYVRANAPAVS